MKKTEILSIFFFFFFLNLWFFFWQIFKLRNVQVFFVDNFFDPQISEISSKLKYFLVFFLTFLLRFLAEIYSSFPFFLSRMALICRHSFALSLCNMLFFFSLCPPFWTGSCKCFLLDVDILVLIRKCLPSACWPGECCLVKMASILACFQFVFLLQHKSNGWMTVSTFPVKH